MFDLRELIFEGPEGMKQMYDYAHSVFPIEKWYHSMGPFEITGTGDDARGMALDRFLARRARRHRLNRNL